MKVNIYINNKSVEDYNAQELETIKKELTYKSMKGAGYTRKNENDN